MPFGLPCHPALHLATVHERQLDTVDQRIILPGRLLFQQGTTMQ